MALIYPGTAPIPQYESSLAKFMPAFEQGQKERADSNAFDAAAKAFGGQASTPTPQQPQSPLERLMGIFGGGQAQQQPQGPYTRPQPPANAVAAIETAAPTPAYPPLAPSPGDQIATSDTSNIPAGYLQNARTAESGGNDAAANPNSSALGRYQFLESTWNGLMQQYPELGLTPDGRTDAAQQERAMAQFTQDNARALSGAGIPVDPGTLYAAHFLGAGGAQQALTANPATPMASIVDPAVIEANPQLAQMTAGDFAQWAQQKGGNGGGGYRPPVMDVGAGQGKPFQVDEQTMRTLLASEATRPLAISLIQAQQETQASQGRYVTEEGEDGSIWQRDTLTGERKVLQAPGGDLDRQYKEAQIAALTAKPAVTPTDDQREYAQAVEQGYAGTLQDWIATKPSTGTNVTVNSGDNNGAFTKKADENAAERLGGIVEGGQGAAQFMGDIQALTALGQQIGTGKGAEFMNALGPYAQALGVDIAGLGEAQAYQSIIDRMAPQMRPVGAGATSDFDARQFLSSLPSLGKTPEGNQIVIQTLTALQEHKLAAAEIASLAFQPQEAGGITWQEAEKRIREMPNPYEGFNEYAKRAEAATALPSGVTEEDISYTMQVHGLTREQVLERLNATP